MTGKINEAVKIGKIVGEELLKLAGSGLKKNEYFNYTTLNELRGFNGKLFSLGRKILHIQL